MKTFKVLAALLTYPTEELINALPELKSVLQEDSLNSRDDPGIFKLLNFLDEHTLIELQQNYVVTFDQNPSHSLHLFEHVHGESRDRGQAMVDLLKEYRQHGFIMTADELPDYVPVFLEYLSQLTNEQSQPLLGEAIDVLALIGKKLAANNSAYASVFKLLEQLSPIEAKPLPEAPVRDMDEAMIKFGTGMDGVEPLLTTKPQVVKFYPPQRK